MLAKNLDMEVIAEGIESEEQTLQLMRLDCTLGQGFFYSRPADARQAEAFLENVSQPQISTGVSLLNADTVN